jgi:hypothetical protein
VPDCELVLAGGLGLQIERFIDCSRSEMEEDGKGAWTKGTRGQVDSSSVETPFRSNI